MAMLPTLPMGLMVPLKITDPTNLAVSILPTITRIRGLATTRQTRVTTKITPGITTHNNLLTTVTIPTSILKTIQSATKTIIKTIGATATITVIRDTITILSTPTINQTRITEGILHPSLITPNNIHQTIIHLQVTPPIQGTHCSPTPITKIRCRAPAMAISPGLRIKVLIRTHQVSQTLTQTLLQGRTLITKLHRAGTLTSPTRRLMPARTLRTEPIRLLHRTTNMKTDQTSPHILIICHLTRLPKKNHKPL